MNKSKEQSYLSVSGNLSLTLTQLFLDFFLEYKEPQFEHLIQGYPEYSDSL